MKKIVKIISWLILTLIIVAISLGTYVYQTNDMVRAMANNDESKLYCFLSKTINEMKDLKYSETLFLQPTIKIIKNSVIIKKTLFSILIYVFVYIIFGNPFFHFWQNSFLHKIKEVIMFGFNYIPTFHVFLK